MYLMSSSTRDRILATAKLHFGKCNAQFAYDMRSNFIADSGGEIPDLRNFLSSPLLPKVIVP
jgi:hypothetical protein